MAVGFHEVLSDDITRPGEVKWQRKSDIDVMSATAASDSAASAGEVATTLDGRTFSFNMSPQQMFPIGCFVSLTDDHGDIRLAQVESHRLVPGGPMQATGRMLGVLDADGLDSNATPVLGAAADPRARL